LLFGSGATPGVTIGTGELGGDTSSSETAPGAVKGSIARRFRLGVDALAFLYQGRTCLRKMSTSNRTHVRLLVCFGLPNRKLPMRRHWYRNVVGYERIRKDLFRTSEDIRDRLSRLVHHGTGSMPGTAARKATEARRRKMMDEDENPFLVKPGQKAVHRPRPVVDETLLWPCVQRCRVTVGEESFLCGSRVESEVGKGGKLPSGQDRR
jgi:hypothetical protein